MACNIFHLNLFVLTESTNFSLTIYIRPPSLYFSLLQKSAYFSSSDHTILTTHFVYTYMDGWYLSLLTFSASITFMHCTYYSYLLLIKWMD